MIDPRKLRPSELCRLLNSTPLGEVIKPSQLQRHRTRAGLRIKDSKAALQWIVAILNRHQVPFQITGGLAAKAYGSDRELVDIDIPEQAFSRIVPEVREYVLFGAAHYHDQSWDMQLMTLLYRGQQIDLCGAHQTKIFDHAKKEWVNLKADFSSAAVKEILGMPLPVVCCKDLVDYKRKLNRAVDRTDIAAINLLENLVSTSVAGP